MFVVLPVFGQLSIELTESTAMIGGVGRSVLRDESRSDTIDQCPAEGVPPSGQHGDCQLEYR